MKKHSLFYIKTTEYEKLIKPLEKETKIMANKTTNTQKTMEMAIENGKKALARNVINNAYSLWGKKIASVPVDLMIIDESYQRVLSNNVKKLMKDWDNNQCTFLLVSFRDEKFYVIDGQHRLSVAKAKGIVELPCEIRVGLTREQEALLFARQTVNIKKLSPLDTYKANVVNGDMNIPEVAVDMLIKEICKKYHISVKKRIRSNTHERILSGFAEARCIINAYGVESFDWIIKTITASNWRDCKDAYCSLILGAFKTFYNENRLWIDKSSVVLKGIMDEISPETFMANARYEYKEYSRTVAISLYLNHLVEEKSK